MSHHHNRRKSFSSRQTKSSSRPDLPVKTDRSAAIKSPNPLQQAMLLSAVDGYANALAYLGEDSPLLASGTFRRSGLSWNQQLLTTAYRESWLAMRIIDMPSEDMTRAWYTLTGPIPQEDLQKLKRLEARHSVRQELTNAIRWARLYGGSLALMVIRGEEDLLDQPLDVRRLLPNCFKGLLVLDRAQGISPSVELEENLDDPDYGLPKYYTVDLAENGGSVTIHHSRVLRFVGRELPRMEMIAENYWGASELEHLWEELMKRSATSANIAQLIFQANVTTLKMADFGESLAMGTDQQRSGILRMLTEENRIRNSFGLQLLSQDDSLENHSYSFAGLSDVYEAFMMDMAGAAEIPATRLFGRSPQGLNATGESDLRNYADTISALQERMLRPALEKLLPVMAVSCWGEIPPDLDFIFNPVFTDSPSARAELAEKLSASVIEAFKVGLITREQALQELQARGEDLAVWTKLGRPPVAEVSSELSSTETSELPSGESR